MANPEALVAELNLAQAQSTQKLDTDYLRTLSDDAVPTLVASDSGRAMVCGGSKLYTSGWAGFNLASQHAADARRRSC